MNYKKYIGMVENEEQKVCPYCIEIRYAEEMENDNGKCDWCNSAKCPDCGSEAVGYNQGIYECFECEFEW
jgi:hypothetical protein